MATPLTLPKLGVEMETARLAEWLVADGEEVVAEQIVANVETEKVIFELAAPGAGWIRLLGKLDEEYEIGAELALIAASREEYESLPAEASGRGAEPPPSALPAEPETMPAPPSASGPATNGGAGRDVIVAERRDEPLASPLARRVAAANGVPLAGITGSGPRGTIRRRDVEAAIAASTEVGATPAAAPAAGDGESAFEVIPMSSMRKTIARRMRASLAESAQMTDIREQDVTAVVELRKAAVGRADALGFRLSFTTIFAKAAVIALRAVPELNSSLVGEEWRRHPGVNLGMAVSIDDGLVVPVVHGAERLSVRELHERLDAVISRARDRSATAADLAGGTFTITNFGSYGSHMGTPILMPPQVAILGIGAMVDRPMARDGELAIGKAMYSSLTVDHRVIDGEIAGRFQNEFGRLLAEPDLLLYG